MKSLIKVILYTALISVLMACPMFTEEELDLETYTISYDTNGSSSGSISQNSINCKSGETIILPSIGNVTKQNSVFNGWNTREDGTGSNYAEGSEITITSYDVTFYANWKFNHYNIIFDKNSLNANGEMDNLKLYMNTSASLVNNNFTNEGYVFVGWSTSSDGTDTIYFEGAQIVMESSDITLYAQWSANYCNLIFDKNSESAIGEIDNLKINKKLSGILPLNSLTNTGYRFIGWNSSEDGSGSSYSDGSKIIIGSNDITLYAQWGHSVTFDKNNSSSLGERTDILLTEDTTVSIPLNNFSNLDYTFLNWNTSPDGSGFSYQNGDELTMNTSDIILYAQWIINTLTEGYLTYTYNLDSYSVSGCDNSSAGEIIIPAEIGGVSVTSIGYNAFYACTGLISIIILDSITSIDARAFYDCSSLTSINIPDSVTYIDDRVFYNCSSLTSINIPDSVTSIGSSAFVRCTSLASLTIPPSVTYIGSSAFYMCSSLISMTIPDSITSISIATFGNCTGLISIAIPESVTSIGYNAFNTCTSLTSITIPDGVTYIGECTFSNCYSLTNLTIPESVTFIDYGAFEFCTSLTNLNIPESVTSIDNYVFGFCTSLTNINFNSIVAPTLGFRPFRNNSNITLHIKANATGYDVEPWTDTSVFSSIVRDL